MGLFNRKVNEKVYLNNLLNSMLETRRLLSPQSMTGDRDKDTGMIGSVLATLVADLMIAKYIAQAHPTKAATDRYLRAEMVLDQARRDAWVLSEMFGVNMQQAIEIGREEADRYLQWAGGDGTMWHERGHPGHNVFRMEAVRSVDPTAEQAAEDRMFWGIVKRPD